MVGLWLSTTLKMEWGWKEPDKGKSGLQKNSLMNMESVELG